MTDANTNARAKTSYYLILNRQLGKRKDGQYYLYDGGNWVPDTKSTILGRLIGFDPSEPADSPYAMGNMDIMDTIEVITEQQATEFINQNNN